MRMLLRAAAGLVITCNFLAATPAGLGEPVLIDYRTPGAAAAALAASDSPLNAEEVSAELLWKCGNTSGSPTPSPAELANAGQRLEAINPSNPNSQNGTASAQLIPIPRQLRSADSLALLKQDGYLCLVGRRHSGELFLSQVLLATWHPISRVLWLANSTALKWNAVVFFEYHPPVPEGAGIGQLTLLNVFTKPRLHVQQEWAWIGDESELIQTAPPVIATRLNLHKGEEKACRDRLNGRSSASGAVAQPPKSGVKNPCADISFSYEWRWTLRDGHWQGSADVMPAAWTVTPADLAPRQYVSGDPVIPLNPKQWIIGEKEQDQWDFHAPSWLTPRTVADCQWALRKPQLIEPGQYYSDYENVQFDIAPRLNLRALQDSGRNDKLAWIPVPYQFPDGNQSGMLTYADLGICWIRQENGGSMLMDASRAMKFGDQHLNWHAWERGGLRDWRWLVSGSGRPNWCDHNGDRISITGINMATRKLGRFYQSDAGAFESWSLRGVESGRVIYSYGECMVQINRHCSQYIEVDVAAKEKELGRPLTEDEKVVVDDSACQDVPPDLPALDYWLVNGKLVQVPLPNSTVGK